MIRTALALLPVLVTAVNSAGQPPLDPPAQQYQTLVKEFNTAAQTLWKAETDAERKKLGARGDELALQLFQLAEKHPKDAVALDALIQAVTIEIWVENNTLHTAPRKDSAAGKALALVLRDHIQSDKLGHGCQRTSYGFRKECETFLRTVLAKNPHREVQALACLRLAQFLDNRLQRIDLLKGLPEMAQRYEALFGKEYLEELQGQDRAKVIQEIEALLEQASTKYGDVKMAFGGTVGEQAKTELYALRQLAVGKPALEITGADQDGKDFKLSDYRGKVVLLYFWSEY